MTWDKFCINLGLAFGLTCLDLGQLGIDLGLA